MIKFINTQNQQINPLNHAKNHLFGTKISASTNWFLIYLIIKVLYLLDHQINHNL